MKKSKTTSVYRLMRILHRDIGFFVIGLTVVYSLSGIVLTYRDTDFLKKESHVQKKIQTGLNANQLRRELNLRGKIDMEETEMRIVFSQGVYDKHSGDVSYTSREWPLAVRMINDLHFVSSKDGRHWFTFLYAVSLIFLALSSFWMYKPGSRYFKRGLLTAAAGVVVTAILLLI